MRLDFKQQKGYRRPWHREIEKIKKIPSRGNTANKRQMNTTKLDLITSWEVKWIKNV
jgi:alkylated DNA nucleotide flippase Atl1